MLAIRMQRTGRKGHAQFRVVVQESRLTPTSGRVVYRLGSYNPHTKAIVLDKEKAKFYLENGAQPTPRVVGILEKEGVKLPKWAQASAEKKRTIRNPEKLRKNRPAEPEATEEKPVEAEAEKTEPAPEATPEKVEKAEDQKEVAEEPSDKEELKEEASA